MKRALFTVIALIAFIGLGPMSPASANYGATAQYQVAISANCNNPAICGGDLGGFWGWGVFNTDGSVDAQLTGCGHLRGVGGGATHFAADATGWGVISGQFVTYNETDTFVGSSPGTVFLAGPNFTGIPAAPGHYNTVQLMGFSAPGVTFQIQVTLIPNR